MMSKPQRIQAIANKWCLDYNTTVMTMEEIKQLHFECAIANLNVRDVLDYMDSMEVEWINGEWVVIKKVATC